MTRMTIDFGIDLGTTNSSIAVLRGRDTEVCKNNDGMEYTPSAVWIDKTNAVIVGAKAKARSFEDEENAACEFKRIMGAKEEKLFTRSGRKMTPEEMSAEVLKQLKGDVRQRTGEEIQAAVITVPADFELPQCEATKRAAQLAGFACSPLLQEPVAAALAYAFQSEADNVFWLVFDFGGGTFDAAVVHLREGQFQVVKHGGDNRLGGKDLDWEIVNRLLVPAVTKGRVLRDFHHGSPHWIRAFAKLKLAAEEAKIQLSRSDSYLIDIPHLCDDDRGNPVEFECYVQRKDVEELAEPFILRSINKCKKVLEEARLGPGDVEKVILVGGPTLMPYLRERLADSKHGLGIRLEYGVDPMTVVARGAAIFAGSQRIDGPPPPARAGLYAIRLEYKPIGPDPEPLIGGQVQAADGQSLQGFTVEFVNTTARNQWRSGKILLGSAGSFTATLWAEKGAPNLFLIELCDPQGRKQDTEPAQFQYTIGVDAGAPILIHSLGVALANNETEVLLERGVPLPARKRAVALRTVTDVVRGQRGSLLKIPVVEGEHLRRADRNRFVGEVAIPADGIQRNLPAGSEVEVTIEIDESRLVRAKAFVPLLDEEFERVMTLELAVPQPDQLQAEVAREKQRLEAVRSRANEISDLKAHEVLRRIAAERIEQDVAAALAASRTDADAAYRCQARVRDLRAAVDEVEDALEWPELVASIDKEIDLGHTLANDPKCRVTAEERIALANLERDIAQVMQCRDADLLRFKFNELCRLNTMVLHRQPWFWVNLLDWHEKNKQQMPDLAQAEEYIAQGRRAINNNDLQSLIAACKQLSALRPPSPSGQNRYGSGVIR